VRPEPAQAAEAAQEPGPPPLPPRDLKKRPLPIHVVPSMANLYRIHPANRAALFYGPPKGEPPRGRWDSPDGKFGVCYMAEQAYAAFAEVFLRDPGVMVLEMDDLKERAIALLHPWRDLRLVAMHGAGLHALGATAACCTGAYAVSRAWAGALFAHPEKPDGIRYRARHDDDGFAIALFDRAKRDVIQAGGAALDGEQALPHLTAFVDRYGVGLV
jgi:hypothetical protein